MSNGCGFSKPASFSFDNGMYQDIDSVTMSSPLGSHKANIVVGFKEQKLFDVSKLYCHFRYVDDTFTPTSPHNKADRCFSTTKKYPPLFKIYYGGGE